jgi:hypothetical protein
MFSGVPAMMQNLRADADAGAYHALAQKVSHGLGEIELTENKTVGPPASSVK